MSYVTGFTLQEALATPPTFPTTVDDLATRFPRLFGDGTPDGDATFDAAVDAIVSGFGRP